MSTLHSVDDYRITEHARLEMERRGISETDLAQDLFAPGQTGEVRDGRVVFQSLVTHGEPARAFLLRVFVDTECEPPAVVTAYRTTKIDKYWRDEP